MDGIDTTHAVHNKYPDQKLIAHSLLNEMEYINSMLIEGATGYILKGAGLAEFKKTITIVMQGKQYLSPAATEVVDRDTYTHKNMDGEYLGLNPGERDIIKFVALQKTNQEIADLLFLSVETDPYT